MNNGVSAQDAHVIINYYEPFLDSFVESVSKNAQVQFLKNQILIAEAVRIAGCKKKDYLSWNKSKERSIWKLVKTDEQKEAEAMKAWDALIKNQETMLARKKQQKERGQFVDTVKKKKEAILARFRRK